MFALRGNDLLYYNVGNGRPYTVLEIVEVAKKVSGRPIKVVAEYSAASDRPWFGELALWQARSC